MARLDRYIIDRLQSVNILSIAEDLGIVVKHKKCKCPFHDDKTPSMKFWPAINAWKCYGCGAKGTNIDLVMKLEGLNFPDACKWIAERHDIPLEHEQPQSHRSIRTKSPNHQDMNTTTFARVEETLAGARTLNPQLLQICRGTGSAFCRSLVSNGILTQEQLYHAAEVYNLGQTKDDGVIFWQMDEHQQLRDGKIMFYTSDCHRDRNHVPSWVSYRQKKKGELPSEWKADYSLFGLHLLAPSLPSPNGRELPIVAIVESEKTAIICSELLSRLPQPEGLGKGLFWLATGGIDALTVDALRPLVGYRVIVFPDTDLRGEAYRKWQDVLVEAQKALNQSFYLSDILERHATEDQKRRKIDLADYILESI